MNSRNRIVESILRPATQVSGCHCSSGPGANGCACAGGDNSTGADLADVKSRLDESIKLVEQLSQLSLSMSMPSATRDLLVKNLEVARNLANSIKREPR